MPILFVCVGMVYMGIEETLHIMEVDLYGLVDKLREEELSYYIDIINKNRDFIINLILMMIGLCGFIFLLMYILTGRCQRQIYAYINKSSSPAIAKDKIELFLKEAPYTYNIQYNDTFLCSRKEFVTVFFQTADIVQIHKKVKWHRYKFLIPIYRSSELIFVTKDGRQESIGFVLKKDMDENVEVLMEVCPNAKVIDET